LNNKIQNEINEKLNIHLVLDTSGSMRSCREETVDSINEYIKNIKGEKVKGVFTLTTFNSKSIDKKLFLIELNELRKLSYEVLMPTGYTPLYDAIGFSINELSKQTRFKNEKKVLVIVTDGLENASREFTSADIKSLINQKTDEGWLILYLGADHDAITQSGDMGFEYGKTLQYSKVDSQHAFKSVADKTTTYYRGESNNGVEFFEEERINSNKKLYKQIQKKNKNS